MAILFSSMLLMLSGEPLVRDYASSASREAWVRHPVYGDPSFDVFERLPGNPVVRGAPPLEWPVNGFLFEDPVGGAWYLYVGHYSEGYAIGPDKGMICKVYRSRDKGAHWEELGPIFDDDAFTFEGDISPARYAPDVSVTWHDGKYHLVYDWLTENSTWATLANPDGSQTDSGVGYAWAERPEGPFVRATTPVKRTSAQPRLLARYRRLYASTLIRRANDWLILTLTDSGPYFAWALLGMSAPTPEGPWTDLKPLLHVGQPRYLPPLLEYFPAFQHDGWIYAPATSVAANRNYQALFRVRPESALDPEAWETVAWGGLWHAEAVPAEHSGIWGQTFSGFVDNQGLFTVMFPSRDAQNRGTIHIAQRPWDTPYKSRGFVISGHAGPSIGIMKSAYDAFALHARLSFSGEITLFWNHHGPLGPDRPRSDATLHPLSLSNYQGVHCTLTQWRLLSMDAAGNVTEYASGPMPDAASCAVAVTRAASGHVTVALNGATASAATMPPGSGAMGLMTGKHSRASVDQFSIEGVPEPAVTVHLHTEALLGAGQNMTDWREERAPMFRYGAGAISKNPAAEAKWNVECTAFRLWAPRHPDYGLADLYLNDRFLATIDFAAAAPEASAALFNAEPMSQGYYAVILRSREGVFPVDCLETLTTAQ